MFSMSKDDKSSKLDVLDGLIKYMRKLELAKEDPKNALGDGLDMVKDEMRDKAQRDMKDEEPEIEVEVESPEEKEREMVEGEEPEEEEGEEMSPFQKEMRDYFNDRDRPKVGSSLSFMVEAKRPAPGKASMKSSSEGKDGMDEMMSKMDKKRGRGRPRKG